MSKLTMIIECPNGHSKKIDETFKVIGFPMCDCGMPMFPKSASAKIGRKS